MSMDAIPTFPELTFDEVPHLYKLNGSPVPSVTTIMEPLSRSEYRGVSKSTLETAADKGTAVHNAIENFLKFEIEDIDPDYKGYFDAFVDWHKAHDIVVLGSECRVYHKIMRYAGTIDLIAVIDGKVTLVDFKTTYKLLEKNCSVQLEAYAKALESHGVAIESKKILHLRKDGTFEYIDFPVSDSEKWRVFGALKCVYDYIKKS